MVNRELIAPLTLEDLARRFEGATPKNGYWIAKCPAHDDRRASLSIGISESGDRLLLKCHANCETESILDRVGLNFSDLNIDPNRQKQTSRHNGHERSNGGQPPPRIERIYDYQNPDGTLRYQVLRREGKVFTQRQPDGQGGWIWSITKPKVEAVPYHLPEVLLAVRTGQTVFIPEGEKDVDNLRLLGLTATTNNGGAGNWKPEINIYFRDADVVLLPDNDLPGQSHAIKVARMLKPIARRVRVLDLPNLPPKGDVSDWLAAGGDLDTLTAMLETAPDWEPPSETPNAPATEPAGKQTNRTDLGNAERLFERHGINLHFIPEEGRMKWLIWNGRFWEKDSLGQVYRWAIETVRAMYREASEIADEQGRQTLARWALTSEGRGKLDNMISLTQYMPDVSIPIQALDVSPWLLNCENGTVDLRTGELFPQRRGDLLSKYINVPYRPDAQAPIWTAFLSRIMADNQNLIGFLQRAIGYSLTGDVTEQCLFFLHGTGANGKSTFIETIRTLFGDYAQQTPTETLMYKTDTTGANNDVARLRGARLVAATETDEGQRLAETLIKQLSGGDKITARYLFGEFFEFDPTFKIWLVGNHKPEIRGTDFAIWRRIRLVPFSVTIPEEERDPNLRAKLLAELPGILSWAIRGCLDWQVVGLGTPPEVRAATDSYRATMDTFSAWLEQNTVSMATANTRAGKLYDNYIMWCKSNGEKELSRTKFGLRMEEHGFPKTRSSAGWNYHGIGLMQQDSDSDGKADVNLRGTSY